MGGCSIQLYDYMNLVLKPDTLLSSLVSHVVPCCGASTNMPFLNSLGQSPLRRESNMPQRKEYTSDFIRDP